MTQSQLNELLETESARTLLEAGEERGWIEPAELEAFAVENDLGEPEVADLVKELERIGLEVREPVTEEKNTKAQAEPVDLRGRRTVGRGRQPAALPRRRRQAQAADRRTKRSCWRRRSSVATVAPSAA